jgi:hypothetical protein
MAAFGDENIPRLDITVDNSFRVGCIKTIRDLNGQVENSCSFHRMAADALLQRRAFETFHHDERSPICLANVINRANVRVIERRGSFRFPFKAFEHLRILRQFFREEFQGYGTIQANIFCSVDDSHSTTAELSGDPIVRNGLTDHGDSHS